ncbi:hypothetical protein F2P81_003831 [Scophthalmus maximus]|uniref:Uncharacterized protein n=1 Tax=Scophthalmus maximus TaxID=52904 RepID=A0A6A4TF92_SCOMX|nr:hypothetical protein F2P81_003831 [Scophthalmus maximus]
MPEPAKTAPKKGSKKAVTKTAAGKGGKKRRKTRKESYAIYVYKLSVLFHNKVEVGVWLCNILGPMNLNRAQCETIMVDTAKADLIPDRAHTLESGLFLQLGTKELLNWQLSLSSLGLTDRGQGVYRSSTPGGSSESVNGEDGHGHDSLDCQGRSASLSSDDVMGLSRSQQTLSRSSTLPYDHAPQRAQPQRGGVVRTRTRPSSPGSEMVTLEQFLHESNVKSPPVVLN